MNNTYLRAQQLRKKDAKFPFVKIGTQYWTTKNLSLDVTPMGNTIPEVQANANVEKIVNGGFDTDTVWTYKPGWTISGGTANANVPWFSPIGQAGAVLGKRYKITFTLVSISSGSVSPICGGTEGVVRNSPGTYTDYLIAGSYPGANLEIRSTYEGFVGSIDNVSFQEIGWSGSQELYDGIYAQTSGTVEQKTYAAVKAAAMWCNYDNDVAIGAVYGKLYNWFAVKLIQMDIDYYNAAHPTTPYGWRVPTQAEFQTLSTYLGGDAVSGGKMKEVGLTHWNSPNTGADNSSGFTALGVGFRLINGEFSNKGLSAPFYTITMSGINGYYLVLKNDTSVGSTWRDPFIQGYAIRFIKS